jgi:hypothetical protein
MLTGATPIQTQFTLLAYPYPRTGISQWSLKQLSLWYQLYQLLLSSPLLLRQLQLCHHTDICERLPLWHPEGRGLDHTRTEDYILTLVYQRSVICLPSILARCRDLGPGSLGVVMRLSTI